MVVTTRDFMQARFPEKVAGIVLTDGLHKESMLKMQFDYDYQKPSTNLTINIILVK